MVASCMKSDGENSMFIMKLLFYEVWSCQLSKT